MTEQKENKPEWLEESSINAGGKKDAEKSEKRAKQLAGLMPMHRTGVDEAISRFPFRRGLKWSQLTAAERKNRLEFHRAVSAANISYHVSVRQLCAVHRSEDGADAVPLRAPRKRHPSRELA